MSILVLLQFPTLNEFGVDHRHRHRNMPGIQVAFLRFAKGTIFYVNATAQATLHMVR